MLVHVALEVRTADVDACIGFYALLGFERVVPPPSLAHRAAWVERSGTQIHLLFSERPVVPPQGHLAVVVSDYERTVAALRAEGFEPTARREHWGSARSVVRDPGGHRVELMAHAPAPAV
ncbi:MAG: hypothetical protein NVSMB25_13860 [Thermoleophilaceae bacterium]